MSEANSQTSTTTAAAPATSAQNAAATQTPSWLDSLPEDLRSEASLANFAKAENPTRELARSFVSTKKLLGHPPEHIIKLPSDSDLKSEAWSGKGGIFDRLGRPESPEKYALSLPEGVDETVVPAEFQETFKKTAHSAGLNAAQAQMILETIAATTAASQKAELENVGNEIKQGLESLRKEWGTAFEQRKVLADRVLREHGDNDLAALLSTTGLAQHPSILRLLGNVGAQYLAEGRVPAASGSSSDGSLTPSMAKAEHGKLLTDQNFMKAYMDYTHPGHAEAVTRMNNLFKQMHPESR